VSTGYAVLRCTDQESGEFLYQHVLSDQFVSWLLPRMTGTNYPAVNSQDVASYLVLMPPPAVRSKVGQILTSIDEAIEATRAVIEQTRRLKSALQEQLLSTGIGHRRFWKTKIGPVPEDWDIDTVGDLCEFSSGTGFSQSDWSTKGLPIIRIQNLNGSRASFKTLFGC